MNERRNDLEIMSWHPQIALQIQNSDRSPLYDVRNPAGKVCEDAACEVMFRGRFFRSTLFKALHRSSISSGGARRDRTDDLMLAKHALSQLSYGPGYRDKALVALRWWAWEDLNFRPHAYQARALTN